MRQKLTFLLPLLSAVCDVLLYPKLVPHIPQHLQPFHSSILLPFHQGANRMIFPDSPGKVSISHLNDLSHGPSTNVHSDQKSLAAE